MSVIAEEQPYNLWSIAPAALFTLLVLFQGGFYAQETGAAACILAVLAIARTVHQRQGWQNGPLPTAVLVVTSACTLWLTGSATILHTPSLEALSNTAPLLLGLSAVLYWLQLSAGERRGALELICLSAIPISVISIVVYTGVLQLPGAVLDGRLQFTFQYANTAGVYYAAMAALLAAHHEKTMRFTSILPLTCLLLTKSVGAMACLGLIAVGAIAGTIGKRRKLSRAIQVLGGILAILVGIAVLTLFMPDRVQGALQTGAERIIQIMDSFKALAISPVAGIGPSAWRHLYPTIQSAQYDANIVHSAYCSIIMQFGAIGAMLLVLLVTSIVRNTSAERTSMQAGAPLAAAVLALHLSVDMDGAFGSIVLLLVMTSLAGRTTIYRPSTQKTPNSTSTSRLAISALPAIIILATGLTVTYAGYAGLRAPQELATQKTTDIEARLESSVLIRNDVKIRGALYELLSANGRREDVQALQKNYPVPLDTRGSIAYISSLYQTGRTGQGEHKMLQLLKRAPLSRAAHQAAESLFETYGISDEGHRDWAESCDKTSDLIKRFPASLLHNQKAYSPSI